LNNKHFRPQGKLLKNDDSVMNKRRNGRLVSKKKTGRSTSFTVDSVEIRPRIKSTAKQKNHNLDDVKVSGKVHTFSVASGKLPKNAELCFLELRGMRSFALEEADSKFLEMIAYIESMQFRNRFSEPTPKTALQKLKKHADCVRTLTAAGLTIMETTKGQFKDPNIVTNEEATFCTLLHRSLLHCLESSHYTLNQASCIVARDLPAKFSGVPEGVDGLSCNQASESSFKAPTARVSSKSSNPSNSKKQQKAFAKRKVALYRWFSHVKKSLEIQRYYLPVSHQPSGQLSVAEEAHIGHGFRLVTTCRIPVPFRGPMCVSWEAMIAPVMTDEQIERLEARPSKGRTVGKKTQSTHSFDDEQQGFPERGGGVNRLTDTIAGPSPMNIESSDVPVDYFSWKLIGLVRQKERRKQTSAQTQTQKGRADSIRQRAASIRQCAQEEHQRVQKQLRGEEETNENRDVKENTCFSSHEEKLPASSKQSSSLPDVNSYSSTPRSLKGAATQRVSFGEEKSAEGRQRSISSENSGLHGLSQEEPKQSKDAKRRQKTIMLLSQKFALQSKADKPDFSLAVPSPKGVPGKDTLFGGLLGSGGISIGGYDEKVLATGTYAEGVLHSPCLNGFSTYFVDTDGQGLVGLQLWMKACNKEGFGHGSDWDQLFFCQNFTVYKRTVPKDWLALGADGRAANQSGIDVCLDYKEMIKIAEDRLKQQTASHSKLVRQDSMQDRRGATSQPVQDGRLTMLAVIEGAKKLAMVIDDYDSDSSAISSSSTGTSESENSDISSNDGNGAWPKGFTVCPGKKTPTALLLKYKTRDLAASNNRRINTARIQAEGMEQSYVINGQEISRMEMVMQMMQKRKAVTNAFS